MDETITYTANTGWVAVESIRDVEIQHPNGSKFVSVKMVRHTKQGAIVNHHDGIRTYTNETGWVQADPTQPLKEFEPEEKQKPYVKKITTSRNSKCFCGSGKKFKKCCIKTA